MARVGDGVEAMGVRRFRAYRRQAASGGGLRRWRQ